MLQQSEMYIVLLVELYFSFLWLLGFNSAQVILDNLAAAAQNVCIHPIIDCDIHTMSSVLSNEFESLQMSTCF